MPQEKPILSLSVAAELLDLHPRTLMFYEQAGLISPHRTNTKRRLFSIKNLNHLQFIKYLAQNQKTNLKGIKLLLEAIKISKDNGINLQRRLFPAFKLKKLV